MSNPVQDAPARRNADTQPIAIQDPPRPEGWPPAPDEPAAPARPARPMALRYGLGAAAVILILAGAASYFRARPGASAEESRPIPGSLRPYYDRARNGDASAMRMLGTMYYNGLNVPPDPKEGLRWYRKAAAAGSVAAAKDLEQLGIAP